MTPISQADNDEHYKLSSFVVRHRDCLPLFNMDKSAFTNRNRQSFPVVGMRSKEKSYVILVRYVMENII